MAHTYQAGLVSIVIPVYNVAEYLPQCLDSLLGQTYDRLEIICVNDGSTDDSGKVCDDYAQRDARVRVIHKENGGVSMARNVAMQAATGEFITLVDGDDWLEPNTIERCIDYTQQFPEVDFIEYGWVDVVDGKKKPFVCHCGNAPFCKRDGESILVGYVNQATPTTLAGAKFFRSVLAKEVQFPEGRYFEDEIFNFRMSVRAQSYVYIGEPLYNYRIGRPNAATAQGITRRIKLMFDNAIDLIVEMKELDKHPEISQKFSYSLEIYANTFLLHKLIVFSGKFYREKAEHRRWLENMIIPFVKEVRKHQYITYGRGDAIKKRLYLLNPKLYVRIKLGLFSWLYKALNIQQK